jgi:hypothetical protein
MPHIFSNILVDRKKAVFSLVSFYLLIVGVEVINALDHTQ